MFCFLAPKIIAPPKPLQYVYENRKAAKDSDEPTKFDVTLSCGATDYTLLEWHTSGTLTDLTQFTDSNDGSLNLPGITKDQSASTSGTDYWCCVSNDVGTVCSTNGTLVYASFLIHKWARAPSTVSAFHGFDAVIPCRVPSDATPPATVEWTVDQTVIDPLDVSDEYVYLPSGDLEIVPAKTKLNGSVYSCKITNYRVTYSLESGVNTVLHVQGKQYSSIKAEIGIM